MSKRVSISILFFLAILSDKSLAQISNSPSLPQETPVYIDGFDYPSFDPISNYAWFNVHFPLGNRTEFIVGGDHYRTYFADRFTISTFMKQYFTKKSFLLGGHQTGFDLLNLGKGYPNPIPRREAFIGVGYDVKPSLLLQAKLFTPLGDPKFDKVGLEGAKTRLEVGTRLKF
ncbi:hypothetical protein [Flagellimonas sp.]|uniref:hypothetical protein n=1 Tax=Flagellimonas sp. TaxID=2058762 RepID=UPI003B5C5A78